MIERHWMGVARKEYAHLYEEHLRMETFQQLPAIAGFAGARILRREVGAGTEFLIVTIWDSLEAIRKFAGDDIEASVVPAVVVGMMVTYDARVRHYELVE
jgi:heme-degrading monooxygenase HmoA